MDYRLTAEDKERIKLLDEVAKNKFMNFSLEQLIRLEELIKKKDYGRIEFGIDGVLFINSGIGSKTIGNLSLDISTVSRNLDKLISLVPSPILVYRLYFNSP